MPMAVNTNKKLRKIGPQAAQLHASKPFRGKRRFDGRGWPCAARPAKFAHWRGPSSWQLAPGRDVPGALRLPMLPMSDMGTTGDMAAGTRGADRASPLRGL